MKTKNTTTEHVGPLWVGVHVKPMANHETEVIWFGAAGPGIDLERSERICRNREVLTVVFERNNVRVEVDFTDGETFADWIACRRDELAFDDPAFDSEAERAIAHDAIRELYRVTCA
jgi:hypothetical protein